MPKLYCFLLMFLASGAFAGSNSAASLIQQADQLKLYRQSSWLKLLHYDRDHSFVDDKRFFLSPRGKTDPRAELEATISSLLSDGDSRCRFPARGLWLQRHLPQLKLPPSHCPKYEAWRQRVNAHSVTLVLASSYLNSPSSMYGHTFLRFDPAQQAQGITLMSYAVNFGAVVNMNDNSLFYAFKGLFGGYPGFFADGPYYEKVKEYSRLDNRDVWEYRLNLSPAEVDFMLRHLWELKGIRFDYYFFDENCSFRLLELLEVARPGTHLTEEFNLYAIPIDTVTAVEKAGFISSVHYRASNKKRLQTYIAELTPAEKKLARHLAQDTSAFDSPGYRNLPEARRYLVSEVAYQYLRYKVNRQKRSEEVANRSFKLLKEVQRNAPTSTPINIPPPPKPELGHDTAMLETRLGQVNKQSFTEIQLRASYHDLLDNLYAYPPGLSLNIGKLALRRYASGSAQLQYLDLIDITSVSPRDLFFKPLTWKVRAGVERQWAGNKDPLVGHVTGGVGWTVPVAGSLNGFAMLQSRLEYNNTFDQNLDLAGGASAGLLLQHNTGSFILQAQQLWFTDGLERRDLQFSYQLPLARDHGLRLVFKRELLPGFSYNEQSISYRYYF